MRFQYHPEAARELVSSIKFYQLKSEGLGKEFLDEIENSIAHILALPDAETLITHEDRRILLNRFPFGIIYVVTDELITIYAIMHLKRDPDYWKSRKK